VAEVGDQEIDTPGKRHVLEAAIIALNISVTHSIGCLRVELEPMNGLELLKEIRQDAALSRIPFILVSADSNSTGARPGDGFARAARA
jgi:CheY-like chemotaxis protein